MADKKISQLTDGTSFQSGDEAVVNRGGVNLKVDPTVFTEITENGYAVVSQADIGTDPNQVPLNQYLGSMAYQDLDAVSITGGTATLDELTVVKDGDNPATLNRLTSDGAIVELQKDGTDVGLIAAISGDLAIGTGDVALRFQDGSDNLVPHNVSTNSTRDAAINLGTTGARFKDLYLSGGVYLGGTVAANQLDDYEAGTWTPVLADASSGGNVASGTATGSYVKTGSMVVVRIQMIAIDTTGMTAGNEIYIRGLPFSSDSNAFNQANVSVNDFTFSGYLGVTFLSSSNNFRIKDVQSNVENDNLLVSAITSGTADLWCVLTYFTT